MKKFDEEKFIAIDMLQFFYSAANLDRRIHYEEERKLPTDILRERVEEIQKAVGPIPEWMLFLFRGNAEYEDERRSFAGTQIDKRMGSYAVSLEEILAPYEKKETFFEALADYFVPGAEGYVKNRLVEGDADVWYRECAKKGVDMADRVQLLHLCSYYEELTHEAREVFIRAYRAVERLHEKEAAAIDRAARLLEQEDVQEKIRKYSLAELDPDDVRFGIFLLSPYCFGYYELKERIVEIVAGDLFLEGNFVPAEKPDQDFLRFVVACGNKFKIEAVSLILKNGSMTLTQLSEAMGVQTAALIRPLTALVDDEILFREKKVGRSVYYNINPETYRAVRRSVMEFWKKEF